MKGIILLLFILGCLLRPVCAQKIIAGFECAATNAEYEYHFNAGWDSSAQIEVCVKGGVIAGNKSSCITGTNIVSVRVQWNEDSKSGTISVRYPKGSLTKNVFITPPLSGGNVDTSIKIQYTDYQKIPRAIICSEGRGGNCNPVYSYQWQQSSDILKWIDIKNENSKDLKFSAGLTEPTYFRRKLVEKATGSIAYSDEAAVFINPRVIK